MTDFTTLPYRCPKCFYRNSFPDITTLRTHLELEHSYVQLSIPLSTVAMVTSPVSSPRSYSPRSTFPVVGRKKGFKEQARELEAQLLLATDKDVSYTPRLVTSRPHNNSNMSHASVLDALLMGPPRDAASPGYFGDKDTSSPGYYGNKEEVGRLKQELKAKEHDLAKATLHLQEMQFEQVKAQDENQGLSQTVESHSKEIAELKSLLREQHREIQIQKDERKLLKLTHFLEDIDTKQTTARESLKHHLDSLVDRAEQAEMDMLNQSAAMAMSESPRCLWLASCYCTNLCSVTYVSQTDPAGHEVIWALGAGCRKIESLKMPPLHPCDQPYKFNNRCTQMIGRCWPQLKALSIGGKTVDGKGLVTIAKNCLKLQVLELDHMSKVTEPVAIAMTRNGLRGLQILIFRHTPVTTKAILQFNGGCSQLRSMSIQLSPSDYFMEGDETNEENRERFEQLHKKLQVLAERPGLREVVHLFIMTPV